MAVLNITYCGMNGDLIDEIEMDATDRQVIAFATEAVRGGHVPGIAMLPDADFTDFVVQRFNAINGRPARIMLRPKVPFGGNR